MSLIQTFSPKQYFFFFASSSSSYIVCTRENKAVEKHWSQEMSLCQKALLTKAMLASLDLFLQEMENASSPFYICFTLKINF